jgi:hypothetical protein
MTTKIDRRTFGIPTGSKEISGKEAEFVVNPLRDRRIVISDQTYAGETSVMVKHANLEEMIARVLTFHEFSSWMIETQLILRQGETVIIGPIWSRLKIRRES